MANGDNTAHSGQTNADIGEAIHNRRRFHRSITSTPCRPTRISSSSLIFRCK